MKNKEIDSLINESKSEIKRKEVMEQISLMNMDNTPAFLSSTALKPQTRENDKRENGNFLTEIDSWFDTIDNIDKQKRDYDYDEDDPFENYKKKRKKKKKKKAGQLVDYKKEFEPEMALFRTLLQQQSKFTNSLQKSYDELTQKRSYNSGLTKQMNDLIENITGARNLSMQLVEKNVQAKKTVAELTLKQNKELGADANGANLNDFASTYLKQLMDKRKDIVDLNGSDKISDYDEDLINQDLSDALIDSSDEEVENYLKYEDSKIKVYVVINGDDIENYEFVALDQNNEEVRDYPLPIRTSININRSTNIATDIYGQKYPILYEGSTDVA